MKEHILQPLGRLFKKFWSLPVKKKILIIAALCLICVFLYYSSIPIRVVDLKLRTYLGVLFLGFERLDCVLGIEANRDRMEYGETLLVNVYFGGYAMYTDKKASLELQPYTTESNQFTYDWTPSGEIRIPRDYSKESLVYPSKLLALVNLKTLPFVYKLRITHSDLSQQGEGEIKICFKYQDNTDGNPTFRIPLYFASDDDEIAFSTISVWDAKLKLLL